MKFYETHFDEYNTSVDRYNLHPELTQIFSEFPKCLSKFENLIVYGAPGVGKYSQVLHFLKGYSPSELKYEKKMKIETDKQSYTYCISDIHYEIDMSFLGCNSKILWHELFLQIVDIISMKPDKIGIIVCKNFQMIHSELLDIFYQYMQQYNNTYMNILIKYVIITEHISFIPDNILNSCEKISIARPTGNAYQTLLEINKVNGGNVLAEINSANLLNLKELHSFSHVENANELPVDIFNIVCNQIIEEIEEISKMMRNSDVVDPMRGLRNSDVVDPMRGLRNSDVVDPMRGLRNSDVVDPMHVDPMHVDNNIVGPDPIILVPRNSDKIKPINFSKFRDSIYDILIYNLDVADCLWYILSHFIENGSVGKHHVSRIMTKLYPFLKYYNNNYRPIYHLESILFYFIIQLYNLDEQIESVFHTRIKSSSGRRSETDGRRSETTIPIIGKKISSGQK